VSADIFQSDNLSGHWLNSVSGRMNVPAEIGNK
jgi:hypothetical protein